MTQFEKWWGFYRCPVTETLTTDDLEAAWNASAAETARRYNKIIQAMKEDIEYLSDAALDCRLAAIRADELRAKYDLDGPTSSHLPD